MIPIDLKGRRALVTGGDSGLGAATAKSLAQAGADIAITYQVKPEAAERLAGTARSFGVFVMQLADISDRTNVADLFRRLERELGGVDILVNNAGMDGHRASCVDSDPEAWRKVIDVDLTGAYYCGREAVARMRERKRGVIVNTTSVHEFIPWPDTAPTPAPRPA